MNDGLKEYEVFFHDLRNEFAHIIETNKSKLSPMMVILMKLLYI